VLCHQSSWRISKTLSERWISTTTGAPPIHLTLSASWTSWWRIGEDKIKTP